MFVALVGSTAWTAASDPRRHAEALARFEQAAWGQAVRNRGRLVKMIGDEAMVADARSSDTPELASSIGPYGLSLTQVRWRRCMGREQALPFEDGTFDRVRCERVLQHVEHPTRVVAEILRVLTPGSKALLIDPNHEQADLATDDPDTWRATLAHSVGRVRNPRAGLHLSEWMDAAGSSSSRSPRPPCSGRGRRLAPCSCSRTAPSAPSPSRPSVLMAGRRFSPSRRPRTAEAPRSARRSATAASARGRTLRSVSARPCASPRCC